MYKTIHKVKCIDCNKNIDIINIYYSIKICDICLHKTCDDELELLLENDHLEYYNTPTNSEYNYILTFKKLINSFFSKLKI
jgi:hypothetical protein